MCMAIFGRNVIVTVIHAVIAGEIHLKNLLIHFALAHWHNTSGYFAVTGYGNMFTIKFTVISSRLHWEGPIRR